MNIPDLSSGSQSNESPTATTSHEFKSSSDEDTDIAFDSWCSGKDLLKAEAVCEEEASRLAEQIVSLVEIEKGDSPLLCPPPSDFEIRENSDLWHCSPALPPPAVYGQPSPSRQPMPSPFALPVYGQIQSAYALTPNAYGTPLSAHQDVGGGGLAVEALDIAAAAQPASGRQDAVRMLSDFDPFRGYGQRQAAEVPPRHSKQQRAPRGHSSSSSSSSSRHQHRAEAIRESDVPPRFRKRKKADGASLRAKEWAPRNDLSFGPPPRGSRNQGQCPAERTSIRRLMMKY